MISLHPVAKLLPTSPSLQSFHHHPAPSTPGSGLARGGGLRHDRLTWELAGGRLATEHHGIGAVPDGVPWRLVHQPTGVLTI